MYARPTISSKVVSKFSFLPMFNFIFINMVFFSLNSFLHIIALLVLKFKLVLITVTLPFALIKLLNALNLTKLFYPLMVSLELILTDILSPLNFVNFGNFQLSRQLFSNQYF